MSEVERKRHPIKGLIFGLLLGLGLALLAISYSLAPVGEITVECLVIAGAVLGLLWGLLGPAKDGS